MKLATGVGRQCVDLVKFDIVRDFFQTIGLFFANLASPAMEKAKVIWVRAGCTCVVVGAGCACGLACGGVGVPPCWSEQACPANREAVVAALSALLMPARV